ncbi:hypothetical protein SAMN00768000_0292 [Sulfobacillus thermosulfidooxidans DSM 9293]|uniref:Uncharacterized protein n=1 Tax=Sulfobacillus thermosulfidooxidans (strain DSM 9293 / VKM B-1269 / AT-1) TaxID=929705 RepID=A0A1W1W6Z8_SULTA|nr:hypothetical protein SAMN00768000_0292 [Sulfobacillus thermosulfidooxidans DSM 9293]
MGYRHVSANEIPIVRGRTEAIDNLSVTINFTI